MTQVTQLIPSYLGGVSRQTDDKKKPGQVSELINAMPDITYGLLKRSGFNWIRNVVDSNGESLDHAKWFFVNRGGLDAYVGAITEDTGSGGNISVWNGITGVQAKVEYPSGNDYLDVSYNSNAQIGPEQLYSVTTIQDVTVITNTTKVVESLPAPGKQLVQNGTIKLLLVEYGADYEVRINDKIIRFKTRNFDDPSSEETDFLDADELLTKLKTEIEDANVPGLDKITQLVDCIELEFGGNTEITTLQAKGGIGNAALDSYATDVADVSKLATQSIAGRTVQIINSSGEEDDYWLEFEPDFGSQGPGGWVECRDPEVSPNIDNSTTPHELELDNVDSDGVATFNLVPLDLVERKAGDDTTNLMPSFVGSTIQYTFFYSNRLGFLSDDNVCMSTANDVFNFFRRSAQLLVASDPVDVNVASIQPVRLIGCVPESQGLILYGTSEQFRMYSLDTALSPLTAQVRTLSTYEIANYIPPKSVGTASTFISKDTNYSRCFLYEPRGLEEPPSVVDISKVVQQWIPSDVTDISTSSQNSMIVLSSSRRREVFIYRYFNNGREDQFQAWAKWEMPGEVVGLEIIFDQVYAITKQGNQYTLLVCDINENSRNNIIKGSIPFVDYEIWSNPFMDMMFVPEASDLSYDATKKQTTITLPYNSVDYLTPTVMLTAAPVGDFAVKNDLIDLSIVYQRVQNDVRGSDNESGYFTTPTVDSNTWIIDGDWTSLASRMVCGYRYLFEVELPTTYYNVGDDRYDYTANLTIARHRFSVAFTGALKFSLQSSGRDEWTPVYQVTDADYYHADQGPLIKDRVMTVPVYRQNKSYKLKVHDTTPLPTSLISQMWEGNYVPRFYKRKL